MEIRNKKHYNKLVLTMKEKYELDLKSVKNNLNNNEITINNKKIKVIKNESFSNNNKINKLLNTLIKQEYDGVVFITCNFKNSKIEISSSKYIYYLNCTIESSCLKFQGKQFDNEFNGKVYIINSLFNKFIIENFFYNIFVYNDNMCYEDDALGLKLINCCNSEIVVINKNKNIFNLMLENSKYVGIFLYSLRKLVTILDEESNSMKYFYYNVEFENSIEINSLKQVTSRYYRYLKINYDENRFVYYELLKYLEYLLGNKYKKIYALLFKYLTGYFISPIKIILICTTIIIVSSIFYLFTGISVDNTRIILYDIHNILSLKITDLLKAMYLSVTTFSTLGYGNIIPLKYGEAVASIEMILGAIYISIFTGTIFKRYID
ncbi:potassium channel family protein [uncultured Clostridium sp.]|uniref:potassium channel family protein n=1 Tax=uncultured Clostridium sp. TaxID=59620 RepID=UPI0028EA8557|nr:potassium channel family protein [uncultured Clostridium sp.]